MPATHPSNLKGLEEELTREAADLTFYRNSQLWLQTLSFSSLVVKLNLLVRAGEILANNNLHEFNLVKTYRLEM